MPQTPEDVARGLFEAFDRGDLPGAACFLTADVEWDNRVLLDESVVHGRDAVVEYWERILSTFPFAHEAPRFIPVGDRVCVLTRLRALGAGSGLSLVQTVGYAATVRGAQITHVRFFGSQAEAIEAVGLDVADVEPVD
jgi:ketosteroid isomerase-like protein